MGGPARGREHAQVSASLSFSVSVKPDCLSVCPPQGSGGDGLHDGSGSEKFIPRSLCPERHDQ